MKQKKQKLMNMTNKQLSCLLEMGFEPKEWWVNIAEEKETGNERYKRTKITKNTTNKQRKVIS